MGGVFRHVRDLAEAQTAMGHAVGLVCAANTGSAFDDSLFAAISPGLELGVHRLPMQRGVGLADLTAIWRTLSVIRGLRPDVVHGHGAKGGAYARFLGGSANKGRFYSPHGGSLHFNPATARGRLVFGAENLMQRLTDGLFFVCEFERRTFLSKVGSLHAPSEVVYNGLRHAEFEPVPLGPEPFDLLFIGEIRALKGPDILISAIPSAEKALGRQVRALIVGNGAELDSCHQLASQLGLLDRVAFRPAMPAREAFGLARIVVVPSRAEAFPYIVIEALAAGRPVVASAVGGIPEVFGAGSPALVAPNVDILAERLASSLMNLSGFQASMPNRANLRQRFSVNTMAARITAGYGTLR